MPATLKFSIAGPTTSIKKLWMFSRIKHLYETW